MDSKVQWCVGATGHCDESDMHGLPCTIKRQLWFYATYEMLPTDKSIVNSHDSVPQEQSERPNQLESRCDPAAKRGEWNRPRGDAMLALMVTGFLGNEHDQSVHHRRQIGVLPSRSREDRVGGVRNRRHSAPGQ